MNRQSCARGVFHVHGRQLTKQLKVLWYCVASARLGSQSLLQRGLFLMLQVLICSLSKYAHHLPMHLADTILTAVDQGKYFMCNLPDDMSHVTPDISKLIDLRQQHQKQEWWDSAFLVQDPAKATLWLLGNEVCGTRFHLDWTEANPLGNTRQA